MVDADPTVVTRLEAAEALAHEAGQAVLEAHRCLEQAEIDYQAERRHAWTVVVRGWVDVGQRSAAGVHVAAMTQRDGQPGG